MKKKKFYLKPNNFEAKQKNLVKIKKSKYSLN